MSIGTAVRLPGDVPSAVERVTAALKEQGFGVLTTIDVRATLETKLGERIDDYVILGACNPALAHRALGADPRIGLLLPCNVVVRADGDATVVEAIDPSTLVTFTGNQDLTPVAREAAGRLAAALATLTN